MNFYVFSRKKFTEEGEIDYNIIRSGMEQNAAYDLAQDYSQHTIFALDCTVLLVDEYGDVHTSWYNGRAPTLPREAAENFVTWAAKHPKLFTPRPAPVPEPQKTTEATWFVVGVQNAWMQPPTGTQFHVIGYDRRDGVFVAVAYIPETDDGFDIAERITRCINAEIGAKNVTQSP